MKWVQFFLSLAQMAITGAVACFFVYLDKTIPAPLAVGLGVAASYGVTRLAIAILDRSALPRDKALRDDAIPN
jgi:hypothetical protein